MQTELSISQDYHETLEKFSLSFQDSQWEVKENYPFLYFINKEFRVPGQGWKIHVSCLAREVPFLLEAVSDILQEEKVSFKVVSTYEDALRFNSGDVGITQIGKIVTVYPKNTEQAYSLGKRLDKIWHNSTAPAPPSDRYFRPEGNVSLRFGAINNEKVVVHHDQESYPALVDPDGNLVPDISSKDGEQVSWAPALPETLVPNGYFGKELDYLKQTTKGRYAVVYPLVKKIFTSTFLCIDLLNTKPVLIKVYYKKADENGDGMSIVDSGKNEAAIADVLSKAGLAPNVLDIYEDKCFYYIVSEYIIGDHYAALPREKRVKMLPLLMQKVQQMHDLGIVHRDLKLANIMVKGDELFFIDFALSARTGTIQPLGAGTKGYIPPDDTYKMVAPSYDRYSLGSCLIHAYVGIDAAVLPADVEKKLNAVASYIPAETLDLIKDLYNTDATLRPTAEECISRIRYSENGSISVPVHHKKLIPQKTKKLIDHCLISLKQKEKNKCYSVLEESKHKSNTPQYKWGLNTGIGGRVLGLLCLVHEMPENQEYLALAKQCATFISNNENFSEVPPGLFTGLAGSALALGASYVAFGDVSHLNKSYELLNEAANCDCEYDFFAGYAGIAYAALKIFQSCGEERFLKIADKCIDILLTKSEVVDGITAWKVKRAEAVARYETGAAHGTSGIAMVIALYGVEKRSEKHIGFAVNCFRRVFDTARSEERRCFLMNIGLKTRHPAPNNIWCHGAAGYLWCLVQLPQLFDRLKNEIEWTINVCSGISHLASPTYCHGMAGSLELWRMVNATPFRNDITQNCFENTLHELVSISQEHNGLELFPSEEQDSFSPDLWIGYLGPACSLALAKQRSTVSILNTKW